MRVFEGAKMDDILDEIVGDCYKIWNMGFIILDWDQIILGCCKNVALPNVNGSYFIFSRDNWKTKELAIGFHYGELRLYGGNLSFLRNLQLFSSLPYSCPLLFQ